MARRASDTFPSMPGFFCLSLTPGSVTRIPVDKNGFFEISHVALATAERAQFYLALQGPDGEYRGLVAAHLDERVGGGQAKICFR